MKDSGGFNLAESKGELGIYKVLVLWVQVMPGVKDTCFYIY
jgi:hypothetical protein